MTTSTDVNLRRCIDQAAVTQWLEDEIQAGRLSPRVDPGSEARIARMIGHATARGWTPKRSKKEASTSGTPSKQG